MLAARDGHARVYSPPKSAKSEGRKGHIQSGNPTVRAIQSVEAGGGGKWGNVHQKVKKSLMS